MELIEIYSDPLAKEFVLAFCKFIDSKQKCLFSTDDPAFGGLGRGDAGPVKSQYIECHGREQAITLSLPPMSAAIYKCTRKFPSRRKKTAEAAPKAAKSDKAAKAAPKKTTRKSKES